MSLASACLDCGAEVVALSSRGAIEEFSDTSTAWLRDCARGSEGDGNVSWREVSAQSLLYGAKKLCRFCQHKLFEVIQSALAFAKTNQQFASLCRHVGPFRV